MIMLRPVALRTKTLHIAISIGYAVDPASLDVDRIEAEQRRRGWTGLRMLCTFQNTSLGNLMPFRMDAWVVNTEADVAIIALSKDDRC